VEALPALGRHSTNPRGLPFFAADSTMTYDLSIRPNRTGKTSSSRGAVEFAIAKFPQFQKDGVGRFVCTDGTRRELMRIQFTDADLIESIRVSIPVKSLKTDGVPVLDLCFQLANQLGWGILDDQMGAYIERDAIPNVLNYCAAIDVSVTQFLNKQPPGRAQFSDMFLFYARTHTRLGLIALAASSAVLAGFAVLYFDMRHFHFVWIATVTLALMVSAKRVPNPRSAPRTTDS
jgi:hypothetical protein